MNAIQIQNRVELYLDSTRNARFGRDQISLAVNDAIQKFINDQFGDESKINPYSFESIQQIRDNLFTLIKTATPTVTNLSNKVNDYYTVGVSRITNPTDYYDLVSWTTSIAGVETYGRPTTYNELNPLCEDSLKYPKNNRMYYLEDATGYKFYRGTTGTLVVTIEYIKTPATYNCGSQNQLIGPGNNLTINLDYIAIEQSENNLVVYQPGQLFTAGSINLVSGKVILASNTTTCDLPAKTHETIAKMAAEILSGVTADYNRASYTDKEIRATN